MMLVEFSSVLLFTYSPSRVPYSKLQYFRWQQSVSPVIYTVYVWQYYMEYKFNYVVHTVQLFSQQSKNIQQYEVFLSSGRQDIMRHTLLFSTFSSFFLCLALLLYSYHIHILICRVKLVYFQHCCIGPNFAITRSFFSLVKSETNRMKVPLCTMFDIHCWFCLFVRP